MQSMTIKIISMEVQKISLKQKISELKSKTIDIPIIINGKIKTNDLGRWYSPQPQPCFSNIP